LARPIHIKDDEAMAVTVKQTAQLLAGEAVLAELVKNELTERFETRDIDVSEETAEGRAMRHLVTAEERHEGTGKGSKALKEGFEGRFSASGIAKQERDEVNHVVAASPTASEPHTLADGVKETPLRDVAGQDNHLGEPGGNGRNIVGGGVNLDGGCG
jgi:hypothetical protein